MSISPVNPQQANAAPAVDWDPEVTAGRVNAWIDTTAMLVATAAKAPIKLACAACAPGVPSPAISATVELGCNSATAATTNCLKDTVSTKYQDPESWLTRATRWISGS